MPPAGAPPVLDLRIAGKTYPGASGQPVTVVRDLAFTVGPRESVALVGPSGCGKTTSLNIVAGLDSRFDGSLSFPALGGREPHIACVFQEPRLLPWRTLEQNLELVLPKPRRGTGIAAHWLAHMGLAEAAQRFPTQVSLGMQRRAALARAFAVEPDLLLLDEPFVSLDGPLARRLRRLLLDTLAERPCAALLVTHDLREAIELADRILILSPSPTRVVAEVTVPGRREDRTERDVEAFRQDLVSRPEPVFRLIA
ncbi:ATP-binding cassette domain-containing protein [Aerophototrophica crusticola]|uniref:ATP-binding cassette domain-containing protein n=1 Tax=Aerophototrophica crusticola TaxID=1709002 RepID=A0A858R4V3_9PROT|nr:ATP-binding cassette domain-containing protein [Rhodospirillaceae bacterium B3]